MPGNFNENYSMKVRFFTDCFYIICLLFLSIAELQGRKAIHAFINERDVYSIEKDGAQAPGLPTGLRGHRGPHWDVQDPQTGDHRNVLPGGRIC